MRYGKASRISSILPLLKTDALAKRLRALAHQRKTSSLLHNRRRGHTPRGTLRRRKQRCSSLTLPFFAALEAIPAEDWCRTWAAGRTITLRRTSKRVKEVVDKMRRVKEVVDKMRLSAVVRLCRGFWDDDRNGTVKERKVYSSCGDSSH